MTREEKLVALADIAAEFSDITNEAFLDAATALTNELARALGFDFGRPDCSLLELVDCENLVDYNADPTPVNQWDVTEGRDVSEPLHESRYPQ